MKRFITIFMALAVMLSLLGIGAAAASFKPLPDPVKFTVKKADSSLVVKDGLISAGEYERLSIDTSDSNSPLNVVYSNSDEDMNSGLAMLSYMEYYFSWDEVHGFNFAVRFKPTDFKQVLNINESGEFPEDNFLKNMGVAISSDPVATRARGEKCDFYYAVARDTQTGAYLQGHYGQFGATGSYNPVAGTDFCVSYDTAGGYATCEWSIPFDVLATSAGAGNNVYFTISATSGRSETVDGESWYGIVLGDYGYGVDQKQAEGHATATLSDEIIDAGSVPTPNPGTGSGTAGTPSGTVVSGEGGSGAGTDGTAGEGGANGTDTVNASQTSDPMLILAAVSAVSACGALVIKKRRS